jgi:hypothetical protein
MTRFLRSHPKDRPIQSPLTTHEGVSLCRIYSNLDPHGLNNNGILLNYYGTLTMRN